MTNMNKPKKLKDPVMICGKLEERKPKANAGTTSTKIGKGTNPEEKEALKGMKFVPQVKKKKKK